MHPERIEQDRVQAGVPRPDVVDREEIADVHALLGRELHRLAPLLEDPGCGLLHADDAGIDHELHVRAHAGPLQRPLHASVRVGDDPDPVAPGPEALEDVPGAGQRVRPQVLGGMHRPHAVGHAQERVVGNAAQLEEPQEVLPPEVGLGPGAALVDPVVENAAGPELGLLKGGHVALDPLGPEDLHHPPGIDVDERVPRIEEEPAQAVEAGGAQKNTGSL